MAKYNMLLSVRKCSLCMHACAINCNTCLNNQMWGQSMMQEIIMIVNRGQHFNELIKENCWIQCCDYYRHRISLNVSCSLTLLLLITGLATCSFGSVVWRNKMHVCSKPMLKDSIPYFTAFFFLCIFFERHIPHLAFTLMRIFIIPGYVY